MFNNILFIIYLNIMETDKETKNIKGPITIEVPEELLKNVRNIIEVANGRIQWKTEELLPVGLIIKQLDDLLKQD